MPCLRTCHYVPPSVLFNFTRGEEVSRTLFPRLSDIRPLRSFQTNLTTVSLRSVEYVYNNQQPRYYELLRVKSRSRDFGLWSNTRDREGTPRYRFCLGLLDVWLPADNYSWNCFSRRAWPCLRAIIDTEYTRARVNMYMNTGRKRGRVYRAVYALYRFVDRTDTLRWISSGF